MGKGKRKEEGERGVLVKERSKKLRMRAIKLVRYLVEFAEKLIELLLAFRKLSSTREVSAEERSKRILPIKGRKRKV